MQHHLHGWQLPQVLGNHGLLNGSAHHRERDLPQRAVIVMAELYLQKQSDVDLHREAAMHREEDRARSHRKLRWQQRESAHTQAAIRSEAFVEVSELDFHRVVFHQIAAEEQLIP